MDKKEKKRKKIEKGRGNEQREKKKKGVSTFSLRSMGIGLSIFIRTRGKVSSRNESYAWVLKSESFVKFQDVENFPTRIISSLKVI